MQDAWRQEPYQIVSRPDPSGNVYLIEPLEGNGPRRTVNRAEIRECPYRVLARAQQPVPPPAPEPRIPPAQPDEESNSDVNELIITLDQPRHPVQLAAGERLEGVEQPGDSESENTDSDRAGTPMSASAVPAQMMQMTRNLEVVALDTLAQFLKTWRKYIPTPSLRSSWNLQQQHRTLPHQAQMTKSHPNRGQVPVVQSEQLPGGIPTHSMTHIQHGVKKCQRLTALKHFLNSVVPMHLWWK